MKRSRFLSVFVPLFLCAAVLTLGYFSPVLYSRVMPDFKNQEGAVSVAGTGSPLYLEDPSSLVLPPWNDIDNAKSRTYASNDDAAPEIMQRTITDDLASCADIYTDGWLSVFSDELSDDSTYVEVSDAYVRSIIQPFLKGCSISPNLKFSSLLHTYDPDDDTNPIPKYVYAQNVLVPTLEGRNFNVDLVFTPKSGLPLYVHAQEVDKETAALPNNEMFTEAVSAAFSMYFLFVGDDSDAASEFDKYFDEKYSEDNRRYLSVFEAVSVLPNELLSSCISESRTLRNADWTVELFTRLQNVTHDNWYGFIYNLDSAYSIDYNNESLLVMRDNSGCTFTLTYDAVSESVTGFGFDPNFLTVFIPDQMLSGQKYYGWSRDYESVYSDAP